VKKVAPFTGAWIEISETYLFTLSQIVAPFTGAWIEIMLALCSYEKNFVAPFTGAWIEIISVTILSLYNPSHPSRVRGLK